MSSLLPAIVGGGIAVVGGAFGVLFQSIREHSRWKRERRYEAYRAFLVEADFLNLGLVRTREEGWEFTPEVLQKAGNAVSGVALVGPQRVYVLAMKYQNIAKTELDKRSGNDWPALIRARSEVGREMQKVLGFDGMTDVPLEEEATGSAK